MDQFSLEVSQDTSPRYVERPLRKLLIAQINNPKDTAQETNLSSLISESQPEAAFQGKTFPLVSGILTGFRKFDLSEEHWFLDLLHFEGALLTTYLKNFKNLTSKTFPF